MTHCNNCYCSIASKQERTFDDGAIDARSELFPRQLVIFRDCILD